MKMPILDLEQLKVDPDTVLKYLESNNWIKDDLKSREQYFLIYKHLTQDNNHAFVLLPLDVAIPDFESRIYDLIKVIAIVESRSQSDVFNSIKSAKKIAVETDRDILNFRLKFGNSEQREILATQLGELLISFQNLINGIACSKFGISNTGKVPNKILDKSRIAIVGTFEGSFGLRIASMPPKAEQLDILQKPLIRQTFEELFYLIKVSEDDEDLLKQALVKLGKRSASSYKKFLITLYKLKTDNSLEWGSLDEDLGDSVEFSYRAVAKALAVVSKDIPEDPIEFEIYGRWVGGNERKKDFEIQDELNEKTYKGTVDDKALEDIKIPNIGTSYNVIISEELSLNEATQEVTIKHILLSLKSLSESST